MTLRFGFTIEGNATDGEKAIEGVDRRVTALKASVKSTSAELAENRAQLTSMAAAGQRSGEAADQLRSRQAQLTAQLARTKAELAQVELQATSTGGAMQRTGFQTGNVVAQFNDIGVMLAAGQSPLVLAIQQGTQLSQVLGQAGAGGKLALLKQGFLGLISPVNFFTIAAIAGFGTVVQYLANISGETKTLQDNIDDLTGSIDDYRRATDDASTSAYELTERFGAQAIRVERLYDLTARLAKLEALKGLNEGARAIVDDLDDVREALTRIDSARSVANRTGVASTPELRASLAALREEFGLTEAEARKVVDQVNSISEARSPYGVVTAMAALSETLADAADRGAEVPSKLIDIAQATAKATISGYEFINLNLSKPADDAEGPTRQFGTLLTQALTIAEAIRDADVGKGVRGALAPALAFLQRLQQARAELAAIAVAKVPGARLREADDERGSQAEGLRSLAEYRTSQRLKELGIGSDGYFTKSTSRGGGGRAKKEAEEVADLIAKLQGEIDALRELDPVQQEMIRYREKLASATEAERAKVEELIATRRQEELAAAALASRADLFNQIAADGLNGLIVQGKTMSEVWRNAAASIAQAAIQAAIFGQGPFGDLFGGQSLFGLILGVPAKAAGGPIEGPGTDTSDNLLVRVSPNEYVVNAAATRRNRPLLDAINSGAMPRFASGGPVTAGPAANVNGGGNIISITVNLAGARGDREIEAAGQRAVEAALRSYDLHQLPRSIRRISADPYRRG